VDCHNLDHPKSPVSGSQKWIWGIEVGGYFTLVNPTLEKMLYVENPSLTLVIGKWLICFKQCWTLATFFTIGHSQMFGPEKP
jgi:hypothetical protein